jgi:DNA-binding Lrp family transcriptional regulator
MSSKIDEIDREILRKLQNDARTSFRKIADDLGVSESTVFVRVKKLKERGVIERFTAIVSSDMVGKGFMAFILIKAEPQNYDAALEALKEVEDIYEIYDVTGNYYAVIKIITRNREELRKTLDKIGSVKGITSTETLIVLRKIKEKAVIEI